MRRYGLLPGGRLDRYVLSLFAGSYAVAFFLVVGLFLILDLAANLDDYFSSNENGPSPGGLLVVRFYLLNIPFIYLQVSPFVTLVAGLFTTAKLVRHNEVVAALGAGVSSQRLLMPVLVGGVVLAGSMFALRVWATEAVGFRRDSVQDKIVERRPQIVYDYIWMKEPGGGLVQVSELRPARDLGVGSEIVGLEVTLMRRGSNVVLSAERGVWEGPGRGWKLDKGTRRLIEGSQDREPMAYLEDISFTPRDLQMAWKGRERVLELSFAEVGKLWERDPTDVQFKTLIEYLKTFPMANVILLLVGLPFLMRHERSRSAEKLVEGFVLCIFFFGADFVSRSMGMQGVLQPMMASWLPVLFFGSLGVVLFGSMRS